MEAHTNCTSADIVEDLRSTFFEDLDSENVGKENPVRDVKIKKFDEKQELAKLRAN